MRFMSFVLLCSLTLSNAAQANRHRNKHNTKIPNTEKLADIISNLSHNNVFNYFPRQDYRNLMCLSITVYNEARGLSETEQKLVAKTVKNRETIRNLDTCHVVAQKGQFPWVQQINRHWQPKEKFAWLKAQGIALLTKYTYTMPNSGCRFEYFSRGLTPSLRRNLMCGVYYPGHLYYQLAR